MSPHVWYSDDAPRNQCDTRTVMRIRERLGHKGVSKTHDDLRMNHAVYK